MESREGFLNIKCKRKLLYSAAIEEEKITRQKKEK